MVGAALWSAGYAAEIISLQITTKIFWAKFQYLGIITVPLAWFLFALRYLGSPTWLLRWRSYWPFLGIIPAATLLLTWTNELHRAVWSQAPQLTPVGPLTILVFPHGAWFWVYVVFSYLLVLLGTIWLVYRLLGSNRLTRIQVGLAMAGALFPWLGNLLYVFHLIPIPGLDWTPFGFTISCLFFSLSLLRYQMVRVVPIAHRTVFEELSDGLLVLDQQDNIIDLNLAARRLIQEPSRGKIDLPLTQALPELTGLLAGSARDQELRAEVILNRGLGLRAYEIHRMSLTDRSAFVIGKVILLHDVTERQQVQAALEKAYAELESRVANRTQELRIANQQLSIELEQRRVAEQQFKDIINSTPDAILVIDTNGRITLVNSPATHIFGWPPDTFIGKPIIELVPERLRDMYGQKVERFFAHPVLDSTGSEYEMFGMRQNGSEFPAEVHLSRLMTTGGVQVACMVRDISARKQAEQEQAQMLTEIQVSHRQLLLLTARLEEVQEIERRQIAAELHDRVGQSLTALNLNLTSIQNKLPPDGSQALQSRLADSLDLVEETTRQVRNVMADLNPPLLEEYGLLPALHWFCEKFSARTGIRVAFTGPAAIDRLTTPQETTLFRIAQEALNNTAKHSQANEVRITWNSGRNTFRLCLEDDGQGFDPAAVAGRDQPHWGLLTMQERAASIGGELNIQAIPGRGVGVTVEVRRGSDDHSRLYSG